MRGGSSRGSNGGNGLAFVACKTAGVIVLYLSATSTGFHSKSFYTNIILGDLRNPGDFFSRESISAAADMKNKRGENFRS